MLLNKLSPILVVILLAFAVQGCESSTENEPNESDLYFHIGDVSQYLYANDTTYQQDKIIGQTRRSDNLKVFIKEILYKSKRGISQHLSYEFVRDGYYFSTELEKTTDSLYKDNPYKEFKYNKVNITQGGNWKAAEGIPDSINIQFSVKNVDELETPAGKFTNIYSVYYYDKTMNTEVDQFYSKEYGRLGSRDNWEKILLNYVKRENIELGTKVEF